MPDITPIFNAVSDLVDRKIDLAFHLRTAPPGGLNAQHQQKTQDLQNQVQAAIGRIQQAIATFQAPPPAQQQQAGTPSVG